MTTCVCVHVGPSSTLKPLNNNTNYVSAAYKSATIALAVIAGIAIVIVVLLVLYIVIGLYCLTEMLNSRDQPGLETDILVSASIGWVFVYHLAELT